MERSGHDGHSYPSQNGDKKRRDETMSPGSSASDRPQLQLPMTVDPAGPNNPPKQLVWVIFGATGHIGTSLLKACLSHNDLVAPIGQLYSNPSDFLSATAATHPLLCDVRSRSSVASVIASTLAHFGRIDVIANCSGYGVIGACEDQDEHEIRNQFETNFMGTLHIIQESLTYFRERAEGRYLILSSTSGALGVPGLGPYCATKYAVEGLIEAMLYEVDSFNIKATLVEPGLVRRDEPDTSSKELPTWGHFLIKKPSPPYADPTSPSLHAKRMVQWLGDKQPTSAVKVAELVWQLGHCGFPPLRLLAGSYALESIRDRLRCVMEEAEDWKHLHFPVDGEDGEGEGDVEEEEDDDDDGGMDIDGDE